MVSFSFLHSASIFCRPSTSTHFVFWDRKNNNSHEASDEILCSTNIAILKPDGIFPSRWNAVLRIGGLLSLTEDVSTEDATAALKSLVWQDFGRYFLWGNDQR